MSPHKLLLYCLLALLLGCKPIGYHQHIAHMYMSQKDWNVWYDITHMSFDWNVWYDNSIDANTQILLSHQLSRIIKETYPSFASNNIRALQILFADDSLKNTTHYGHYGPAQFNSTLPGSALWNRHYGDAVMFIYIHPSWNHLNGFCEAIHNIISHEMGHALDIMATRHHLSGKGILTNELSDELWHLYYRLNADYSGPTPFDSKYITELRGKESQGLLTRAAVLAEYWAEIFAQVVSSPRANPPNLAATQRELVADMLALVSHAINVPLFDLVAAARKRQAIFSAACPTFQQLGQQKLEQSR